MKKLIITTAIILSAMYAAMLIADFTHPQRLPYSGQITKEKVPFKWTPELERRLKYLANTSGPLDTASTLIIVQSVVPWFGSTTNECVITTFEGRITWKAYGRTPEEAFTRATILYAEELRREQDVNFKS